MINYKITDVSLNLDATNKYYINNPSMFNW